MDGIQPGWLPGSFRDWTYHGKIIDDHVHVNTSGSMMGIFTRVAASFGITTIGAITRGFSWVDRVLPGSTIGTFMIPRLVGARASDVESVAGEGARGVKFWYGSSYFHGKKRIDTPANVSLMREIGNAGLVIVMHVSDPDTWHEKHYPKRFYGTKQEIRGQATWLAEQCPGTRFLLVHMGGNPEDPDGLAELLDRHDNVYLDTSATKWVSRELSRNRDAARALFKAHPDRILFGSDITMPPWGQGELTVEEFFASRYLVQRLMLEHDGAFRSPIDDPDNEGNVPLHGLSLNKSILERVYEANATRLFKLA